MVNTRQPAGESRRSFSFSFSFNSRWHHSTRKGPYALRPSLSSLQKVALETVPIFVWLNTDNSRPWRVECRPLPFSTPLSFRRSVLWCSGLSVLRKFFKPRAPLLCQAADQMWYLQCLPVCVHVHSQSGQKKKKKKKKKTTTNFFYELFSYWFLTPCQPVLLSRGDIHLQPVLISFMIVI